MSQYVITGLSAKRDELVRIRDEAQEKIVQIESVLELFDPGKVNRSKPPRSAGARFILEVIRTAERPPTSREITERVLAHNSLPLTPENLHRFRGRVDNILYKQRLRGVVTNDVEIEGEQGRGWRAAIAT